MESIPWVFGWYFQNECSWKLRKSEFWDGGFLILLNNKVYGKSGNHKHKKILK